MNKINNFKPASKTAVNILKEHGYEAFLIGGSVRDFIMGLPIGDIDITTNAVPSQVKEAFRDFRVIETGIKHGTVTVLIQNEPIEITTYRREGAYSDNRHPDSVSFSDSLEDDVKRRDFTMNAVAYDFGSGFYDLTGGIEDIKSQTIRCIGEPSARFHEDALRILRALRFASVLGFRIEKKTSDAVHECRQLLANISAERIRDEFIKLICGKNAEKVLGEYYDVISVFIPEISPCVNFRQENRHHCYDVYTHTLKALGNCKPSAEIRLALFFHDIAKPVVARYDEKGEQHYYGHPEKSALLTESILTRLRFDNRTANRIVTLVRYHDSPIATDNGISPDKRHIKKIMSQTGSELMYELVEIKRCDNSAQNPVFYRGDAFYEDTVSVINEIIAENECFSLKDLKINGNDLIDLGFSGKQIGKILEKVLDNVIKEKIENDYDEIKCYVLRTFHLDS